MSANPALAAEVAPNSIATARKQPTTDFQVKRIGRDPPDATRGRFVRTAPRNRTKLAVRLHVRVRTEATASILTRGKKSMRVSTAWRAVSTAKRGIFLN